MANVGSVTINLSHEWSDHLAKAVAKAFDVDLLELGIRNANSSGIGPGFCAYLMGQSAEKAAQERGARGGSLDERGGKAIQEPPAAMAPGAPTGDEGPGNHAG